MRDLATAFMGPELLDVAMNYREPHRQGNRDDSASPQGVYRCRGEDQWVSISVASEAEWRGFVSAIGSPSWATGDEFGDAFRRWRRRDELDALVEQWTSQHTACEATQKLQAHGVAAYASLAPDAMMQDTHLLARNAFPLISNHETGEQQRAVTPPWRFSETPARVDRWTPTLGQHNMDVFSGILGLPAEEVQELEQAQVIW